MVDALVEWLGILGLDGGGLLAVAFDDAGDTVLCHVTASLFVGEACPPPEGFSEGQIDRLLGLGWLPPGPESPRWCRRWSVGEEAEVAGDLRALAVSVYRLLPVSLRLTPGPCRRAACVVHAPSSLEG